MFWDFTNPRPVEKVNNQVYFKRDLPAKDKGTVSINLNNLAAGKYKLTVYKTGYRANDAYSSYLDLGSPKQLTKQQVAEIKQKSNDTPVISQTITVGKNSVYQNEFKLRENDVFLIIFNKL